MLNDRLKSMQQALNSIKYGKGLFKYRNINYFTPTFFQKIFTIEITFTKF